MVKYPEKMMDLRIKYKDIWHDGYYNGTEFILRKMGDRIALLILKPEEIQEWVYEEWL